DPPAVRDLVPEVPRDLDALCSGLLSRDPAARPTGSEVLHRLAPPEPRPASSPAPVMSRAPAAPLVGRLAHLAGLWDAYRALRRGRPVSVYMHGRSGMGKSALVQHFLGELLERDDAVVLQGRCYERESVPYKALDSFVDALMQYLGRLP